jgi:Na+-driven multidrug efflux pump
MPERIAKVAESSAWWEPLAQAAMLAGIGMAIGIGQLLGSKERLNARLVIGRALSSGGLGMAAGLVLVWVPDLPQLGQFGVAAALASLGTSGLERIFQKWLEQKA